MKKLNLLQEDFFNELRIIQDASVQMSLCNYKGGDIENLLYEATSETICNIMVLIDGYRKGNIKLDLIDRDSKESLRNNIELHDKCADYIKFEK